MCVGLGVSVLAHLLVLELVWRRFSFDKERLTVVVRVYCKKADLNYYVSRAQLTIMQRAKEFK